MGLAAAKNKRKIGDDPNNTKWSRNIDGFGHKALRKQGWQPGQYLGKSHAPQAAQYTAASASHIRTVLREDNLGIGASGPGANTANVCTGLDVFKDLLGRLNGQSEATIEKKRQVRENVKLTLYVERRWGPMRFVRGGFLVGDDETNEAADDTETSEEPEKLKVDSTPSSRGIKTTPGVEADEINPEAAPSRADKKDKKARKEEKKRSKKRKPPSDEDDHDEKEASADDTHREKKRRRREEKDEGKKEKKEKRETKEKKEKKRDKKEKKRRRDETTSEEETTESLPTPPNAASPVPARTGVSGRHLARRRYITQKRAAVADPQALKQIFMIKA